MSKKTLSVSALIVLLLLLFINQSAFAQEDVPTDDDVNAIAKQLYCPVCENIPLDVCPTKACSQWRETIREKLAAGWSEEQIKGYFVEQYGARVLAAPPAQGLNLLIYILPVVSFMIAAFILGRALYSWRRTEAPAESDTPIKSDDPYVARLEEELRKRDA
jgi:cytochrome c-type biogenesis protein CcmH